MYSLFVSLDEGIIKKKFIDCWYKDKVSFRHNWFDLQDLLNSFGIEVVYWGVSTVYDPLVSSSYIRLYEELALFIEDTCSHNVRAKFLIEHDIKQMFVRFIQKNWAKRTGKEWEDYCKKHFPIKNIDNILLLRETALYQRYFLWQMAYSEIYFGYFKDIFELDKWKKALNNLNERKRRYGFL